MRDSCHPYVRTLDLCSCGNDLVRQYGDLDNSCNAMHICEVSRRQVIKGQSSSLDCDNKVILGYCCASAYFATCEVC